MRRLAAILMLAVLGCAPDGLSDHERSLLAELVIDEVPPDPSNAWADDAEAAALGQKFFFDPRFSGPVVVGGDGQNGGFPVSERGHISCASCHEPTAAGVDRRSQPNTTSLAAGRTERHSPTVFNMAFQRWFFWDGRKDSLWSQALAPMENPVEHNFTRLEVAHLVFDRYRSEYEHVFGPMIDVSDLDRFPAVGRPGTPSWADMADDDRLAINRIFANVGKAIAAYERRLVSRDSDFDRFMGGDVDAMSAAAVRGARLFVGRAACINCHNGPSFSDGSFHNIGIPQAGAFVPLRDLGRAGAMAMAMSDEFNLASIYSDSPNSEHLTVLEEQDASAMQGRFRTPTLRDVTLTGPYMHTGAVETLWDVLEFYRFGGGRAGYAGHKDALIRPLTLSDDDLHDLSAFLHALEGEPLPLELVSAPELPE